MADIITYFRSILDDCPAGEPYDTWRRQLDKKPTRETAMDVGCEMALHNASLEKLKEIVRRTDEIIAKHNANRNGRLKRIDPWP